MLPKTSTAPSEERLDPAVRTRLEAIWRQAYAARGTPDLEQLYATWSRTYDRDHAAIGYRGHVAAAELMRRHLRPGPEVRLLDAGAGTGLAGVELHRMGFEHLTALDLSAAMLAVASAKGVYEATRCADLSFPLDELPADSFDGAILVGVFSFGQAPAHALDEILRVVRPGGRIVLTLRTDFHEQDAMGVRSRLEALQSDGALRRIDVTPERPYLPKKDAAAMFRVWCFEVLPGKRPAPTPEFAEAVRAAFSAPGPVKRFAHHHIWDATASRLYDAYIQRPEYYLNESEEEILRVNAGDFLGDRALCVELGCGSADKIRHVLDAVLENDDEMPLEYMPIDVSPGALETTAAQIREAYGDRLRVSPRLGHFDETLAKIPAVRAKAVFFLGGSVGNFETLEETVGFLQVVRERLTTKDRFVIGFDLRKDAHVFESAYNAGEENRRFFVHMLRRINNELGADFDLGAFRLASTFDEESSTLGLQSGCVNLKVATERAQDVYIRALDMRVHLGAGDAVQVGISRKLSLDDVGTLASLAGLRVRSLWFDSRHYFALAEFVREDAPPA